MIESENLRFRAIPSPMKAPAILFVVGASGVGKTTAVRSLEARGLRGVHCYYTDDVPLPSNEDPQMESWSAYLHGQAEALMLPILDTSELGIDAVAAFLERQVESLRPIR